MFTRDLFFVNRGVHKYNHSGELIKANIVPLNSRYTFDEKSLEGKLKPDVSVGEYSDQ